MATTIIAVRTPTFVVLGADSKAEFVLRDQKTPLSVCKILQTKGIFVGVGGFTADTSGFNAPDLVRKAAMGGGDITAIANRFEQLTREPFKAGLQRMRLESANEFDKCSKGECLDAAFIGIERQTPKLCIRSFHVKTRGKEILVVPDAHVDHSEGRQGFVYDILQENAEAAALLARTPHFFEERGAAPGIDELIREEIKSNPEQVGLPISIVVIDKTGPHWIPGHQGVCPDIQN